MQQIYESDRSQRCKKVSKLIHKKVVFVTVAVNTFSAMLRTVYQTFGHIFKNIFFKKKPLSSFFQSIVFLTEIKLYVNYCF